MNQGPRSETGAPEKFFLFNTKSRTLGRVLVWGKSSKDAPNDISGDRWTSFSHQIVFTEKEREAGLLAIDRIMDPSVFYKSFKEAYLSHEKDPAHSGIIEPAVTEGYRAQEEGQITWNQRVEELRTVFHLNERKIMDLMYTALCFRRMKKVYMELPSSDQAGTDAAMALMRLLLSVLPVELRTRAGFVTYSNSLSSDYVNADTLYVFYGQNTSNQLFIDTDRLGFHFVNHSDVTNVKIPKALNELVELMGKSFLSGTKPDLLEAFYDFFSDVFNNESDAEILDTEYEGIYSFFKYQREVEAFLRGEEISLDVERIWELLAQVYRIIDKRANNWKSRLRERLVGFEKQFITQKIVRNSEQNRKKLIALYEREPDAREHIVNYFADQIHTADDLVNHRKYLTGCAPLLKEVSEKTKDILSRLIEKNELEPSLYSYVFSYYKAGQIDKELVETFFADQCTDCEAMEKVRGICQNHEANCGKEIWSAVEKIVYADSSKISLISEREIRRLDQSRKRYRDACSEQEYSAFWDTVGKTGGRNRDIYAQNTYMDAACRYLSKLIEGSSSLNGARNRLKKAEEMCKSLRLPEFYLQSFQKISENYLEKHSEEIIDQSLMRKETVDWPFVESDSGILVRLQNKVDKGNARKEVQREFLEAISQDGFKRMMYFSRGIDEKKRKILLDDKDWLRNQIAVLLRKIAEETEGSRKRKEKELTFDQIHEQLLILFPPLGEQILRDIMLSEQGGILSMQSVYSMLERDNVAVSEIRNIECKMREAILNFYSEYHMGKDDLKIIKAYPDFFIKKLKFNDSEYRMLKFKR